MPDLYAAIICCQLQTRSSVYAAAPTHARWLSEWISTTDPAGTVYGLIVSRKTVVSSARLPSSTLMIFRHSPSPPVGKLAGKDWSQMMKTTG